MYVDGYKKPNRNISNILKHLNSRFLREIVKVPVYNHYEHRTAL